MKKNEQTRAKMSTLTTTPVVGPAATTGSASGGETANGTDDHDDSDGQEHDTKTTYPGYAYSAMSAASSTRVSHDQYDDKVRNHESIHLRLQKSPQTAVRANDALRCRHADFNSARDPHVA